MRVSHLSKEVHPCKALSHSYHIVPHMVSSSIMSWVASESKKYTQGHTTILITDMMKSVPVKSLETGYNLDRWSGEMVY